MKRGKKIKNNKRRFSFKEEYRESWSYLKESQSFIWGSAVLFAVSIVLGYVLWGNLVFFDKVLKELIEKMAGLSGIKLILSIFWNNLFASLMAIVLGVILGIFPIIFNAYNGLMAGYVIKRVSDVSGFSEVWRLLPHGLFEVPAILISFGLGVRLGWFFTAKDEGKELKRRIISSLRVFIFIIFILLVLAAIIEGALITLDG